MGRFKNLELDTTKPAPASDAGREPEFDRDQHFYLREADEARRHGFHENALRYFSRALEFDKTMLEAWVGQVRMLVELEEYPEAVVWSSKALEMFRENPELMRVRRRRSRGRATSPVRFRCRTARCRSPASRRFAGSCAAS